MIKILLHEHFYRIRTLLNGFLDIFLFCFGKLLQHIIHYCHRVILTGIAVGAGVPVAWTYIAEQAPHANRARHVGTAQLAWSLGPAIVFALATALVPLGLLGTRIVFAHLFVIAFITWWVRRGLSESDIWTAQKKERDAATERGQTVRHRGVRELLTDRRNLSA